MEEKQLLILWEAYVSQPQLWQGWDHNLTPVAFHDQQRAVLFGHPNPPEGFELRKLHGAAWHVAAAKPANFTANSAVNLNGLYTATLMWTEKMAEQRWVPLISHEAFHAYQMANNCPMGDYRIAASYPVNEPLVNALGEVEATLLHRALTGSCGLEYVKAALDARAGRQHLLPASIREYEDGTELGEGLATYIEVRSAGTGSRLREEKVNALLQLNRQAWGADRLRFYYSGMAWALLCDQLVPAWQQAGWQPMAGMMTEALNHPVAPDRQNYPGLDFASILKRQQQQAQQRQKEMDATLALALPGTGLRVEASSQGNR